MTNMISNWWALGLITLVLLGAWANNAQAGLLSIELQEHSTVGGNRYTVADVAQFVDGDKQLWDLLAVEPLGNSPAPGQQTSLTAVGLLGLMSERGYDWRAITVSGAKVAYIHGSEQVVTGESLREALLAGIEDELGVRPALEEKRAFEAVSLPSGELKIEVRFPDRPGSWLPTSLALVVDGRVLRTIPLSSYVEFTLPVVVAPDGIAARTQVGALHLGMEERTCRAGAELTTDTAAAIGLTTRTQISAGSLVKLSQLKVPFDVARGDKVELEIRVDGLVMRAQAIAKNNAYIGQQLLVTRVADGAKYSGLLVAGPVVVLE